MFGAATWALEHVDRLRDRPTAGFIRASQQPMIDTAAGIAAYAD